MNKYTIKKALITDNGKYFSRRDDIFFTIKNPVTNCYDRYIGTITDIEDGFIYLSNIEINREKYYGIKQILLGDIVPYSCNYVVK